MRLTPNNINIIFEYYETPFEILKSIVNVNKNKKYNFDDFNILFFNKSEYDNFRYNGYRLTHNQLNSCNLLKNYMEFIVIDNDCIKLIYTIFGVYHIYSIEFTNDNIELTFYGQTSILFSKSFNYDIKLSIITELVLNKFIKDHSVKKIQYYPSFNIDKHKEYNKIKQHYYIFEFTIKND